MVIKYSKKKKRDNIIEIQPKCNKGKYLTHVRLRVERILMCTSYTLNIVKLLKSRI